MSETWQEKQAREAEEFIAAAMRGGSNLHVMTDNNVFYYSEDYGESWSGEISESGFLHVFCERFGVTKEGV